MTTIETDPFSVFFATLRGGGKRHPPPDEKDRYRYYQCEMKWDGWACTQTKSHMTQLPKANDALVTKQIPVPKWIPTAADRPYIWYTLQPRVFPLKPPT